MDLLIAAGVPSAITVHDAESSGRFSLFVRSYSKGDAEDSRCEMQWRYARCIGLRAGAEA